VGVGGFFWSGVFLWISLIGSFWSVWVQGMLYGLFLFVGFTVSCEAEFNLVFSLLVVQCEQVVPLEQVLLIIEPKK